MKFIIITASEECFHFRDDLKTPALTIMVRDVMKLVVLASDIKSTDPSIVMSHKNLVIQIVNRRAVSKVLQINLSNELKLSLR